MRVGMIAQGEQAGVGVDHREHLPAGVRVLVFGHRAGHEDRGVHVVIDQPVDDRQRIADAAAHVERQRDVVTCPRAVSDESARGRRGWRGLRGRPRRRAWGRLRGGPWRRAWGRAVGAGGRGVGRAVGDGNGVMVSGVGVTHGDAVAAGADGRAVGSGERVGVGAPGDAVAAGAGDREPGAAVPQLATTRAAARATLARGPAQAGSRWTT